MKNNKRGFTLIEVLIVVLIVAILSAIAVPQYQKAVLKSRFSSLMPTTKSIRDGQEIYYMTNGRYADAVSKLDVTTANTDDMTITVGNSDGYTYTLATRPSLKNNLIMYQKHSSQYPNNIHCEALKDHTLANWLCATALKGTPITGSLSAGYNTYILEGSVDDGYFGTVYTNQDYATLGAGDKCISSGAYGSGNNMCNNVTANTGGVCDAQNYRGCGFGYFDNATCIGTGSESCLTSNSLFGSYYGYYQNNSLCQGIGSKACHESNFDKSTCEGTGDRACSTGIFNNQSTCSGEGFDTCQRGRFNNSTCNGSYNATCRFGEFTNKSVCNGYESKSCGRDSTSYYTTTFDDSTCNGYANQSCSNATFSNGSKCYMKGEGACQNNTYSDATSCCVSDPENGYICPDHECQ
jgi:type IV pilus assembly protein PilE